VRRRIDDDGNASADQRRRRLDEGTVDQVQLVRRRRTLGHEGGRDRARLQKGHALATRAQGGDHLLSDRGLAASRAAP
jgi:hypothetical protein